MQKLLKHLLLFIGRFIFFYVFTFWYFLRYMQIQPTGTVSGLVILIVPIIVPSIVISNTVLIRYIIRTLNNIDNKVKASVKSLELIIVPILCFTILEYALLLFNIDFRGGALGMYAFAMPLVNIELFTYFILIRL